MTTLCIVRHGETDWNTEGRFQGIEEIRLNEKGRQQAVDCTRYLKKFNWDVIVTSPLSRAIETANIISKEIGVQEVTVITGLIERDFGSAAGLLPEDRKNKFKDGIIPDAEPKEQTKKRSMDTLKLIDELYTDKNIIVITHGGIINSIMNVLEPDFDFKKIKIQNASITILNGSEYNWEVGLFNYCDY